MVLIKDVEAFFVKVPTKVKYKMSKGGSRRSYMGIIVKITTDEDLIGYGEVFASPGWYSAEAPDGVLQMINRWFRPLLIKERVLDIERIIDKLDKERMGNNFAKSAVDMALHDLMGKSLGVPTCDLIGGRYHEEFEMVGGMGIEEPKKMAEMAAEFVNQGHKTIKIKIGEGSLDKDVERVRAVREAIGDSIKLRVDANAWYSRADAIRVIRRIEKYDLDNIEQPLPEWDFEGMAAITAKIDTPIMADESVHDLWDAYRIVKNNVADIIKIKMSKIGGFYKAQQVINLCEAAGVPVVLGNGINTSILGSAELNLACSHKQIVQGGEFVGPAKLKEDLVKEPLVMKDGKYVLRDKPGLGIEIDEDKIKKFLIRF
jgi:muconate/chloromuconate cycloisomerase